MRIDVFTLVPHAFAWLTEQQPIAGILGTELELRLVNYRDSTPLRAGQVDDEPYGGGAGMVLRVDVVAAALDAVYGGAPAHRVVALTPKGRQLTQAIVEELAAKDGRHRPLLGQPRERVRHQREDVELHYPANPSATVMRFASRSIERMQSSTIGSSTPLPSESTSFAIPGSTSATVPRERPFSSTTSSPIS